MDKGMALFYVYRVVKKVIEMTFFRRIDYLRVNWCIIIEERGKNS